MKKILLSLFLGLALIPSLAFATPVSWDYTSNVLRPLQSMWTKEVKVPYITATSTATSTLPKLNVSTALKVGSDYLTDLTGTGLQRVGTALTLNATGDWTGTLDGAEGSFYIANSFSTTSANSLLKSYSGLTDEYCLTYEGTGTTFVWQTCTGAASGITSLNGQTGATQTFASTTVGTDFSITSSGDVHTFAVPSASSVNRGLLTAANWTSFNGKVSSSSIDTSAELAALITDETGTAGNLVFSTSPTFTTPILGVAAATTLDTGQGANELYDMDQNVLQASAVTFATLDTGQGANELYDMNQNVQTTDRVTFAHSTTTSSAITGLTSAILQTGATGILAEYAGTSCTNQFPRSLSALGIATCASVAIASDVSGLASGIATWLGTPTSANLLAAVTDETGTGALVFGTTPTFTTSALSPIWASTNADVADAGVIRLGNAEVIGWEASPAGTDVTISVDSTEIIQHSAQTQAPSLRLDSSSTGVLLDSDGDGAFTVQGQSAGSDEDISFNLDDVSNSVGITSSTGVTNWDWGTIGANFAAAFLRLPYAAAPTVSTNGDIGVDSTSNQVKYQSGAATRVLGNGNFYPSFTISATSSAFVGTTTYPIGPAFIAETWNAVQCFTDVGTLKVRFGDGTNYTNVNSASTTVGTTALSSNNTFTAAEKRYVQLGTPASSPTRLSCTVSKSITAD